MKKAKSAVSSKDKTEKKMEEESRKRFLATLMESPFTFAIECSDLKVVKTLLRTGLVDLNVRDKDGNEPLHAAAKQNDIGLIHFLIEKGAYLEARNNLNQTPLHIACRYSQAEAAKLFIEKGLDVNLEDRTGCSPLLWVCHQTVRDAGREADIVRLLIEKGADVNAKDIDNWTPLHAACRHGRSETVRLLLEAGADESVAVKENRGWTPLDWAVKLAPDDPAREEIIDLFREYCPELVMEKFCVGGPAR